MYRILSDLPDDWLKHVPEEISVMYEGARSHHKKLIKEYFENHYFRNSLEYSGKKVECWVDYSHTFRLAAVVYRAIIDDRNVRHFAAIRPVSDLIDKQETMEDRAKYAAIESWHQRISLKTAEIDAMLLGLSIELLLKAILISQNPAFITNAGLNDTLTHHRLWGLCNQAKIKLEKSEKRLIRRLQHYIEWLGRYPIPKDFGKAVKSRKEIMQEGIDMDLFNRLYDRLEKHPKLVDALKKERKWMEINE